MHVNVCRCTFVYMVTLTISEARATLPDVVTKVECGQTVAITRHGRIVAVVINPDMWHTRRAHAALATADRIHDLLTTAAAEPIPDHVGLTPQRAEELIDEIRRGRETR